MPQIEPSPAGHATQDSLYQQAAEIYSPSLDRLARAYEFDAEARRDLLQEIHLHLCAVARTSTSDVRFEPGCTAWLIT